VNEFQGIPETPEGIREFRINKECFHVVPPISSATIAANNKIKYS
jgi:hypothetical protein